MISVAEAMARIDALVTPLETETVPLVQAAGRVLAENAKAGRAQPPFPASAMDGYAVRSADLEDGAVLDVVGHIAAGQMPDRGIGPKQVMRIFTGAPVPDGADHILIQEDADADGDKITVKTNRDTAAYIRPAGTDFGADFALSSPRLLSAADQALLAAMNRPDVSVYRRPIVALIPTGNELVWPGETPRDDQIIASNNFGLAAMFQGAGADVRLMPIAKDDPTALAHSLARAADADLIVTLGGASVGDHDLVAQVAGGQGLDLSFYKLAMRPGKPLMAGKLGKAVMIGLPGNPVSSMVCGAIFVRPAIQAMQGLPFEHPAVMKGVLSAPTGKNGPRTHYMRARMDVENGEMRVRIAERQDSALLTVLSDANALAIRAPHAEPAQAGDPIDFCMIP